MVLLFADFLSNIFIACRSQVAFDLRLGKESLGVLVALGQLVVTLI
jgi:hypothetical protein